MNMRLKLMRRLIFPALLLFAFALPAGAALSADNLFDSTVLQEVRLTVNPTDWQTLKDNFRDDTYYHADLTWQGITVQNVGIRSHGQASRSPIKPNLRVDIN